MGGFYSRKYSNAPFTLHGPRLYRHTRSGPRADVCVCTHTKVLCCSGPLLQVVLALMCVYKCPLSCHEVRHIDGPHLCMKSRTLTGPRKTVLTFVLNPTVPTCIAIHVCVCVCVCVCVIFYTSSNLSHCMMYHFPLTFIHIIQLTRDLFAIAKFWSLLLIT